MEILRFGHLLLWAAAVLAGAVLVLCLLGLATRDRRFLLSARSGFYAIFVLLLGASITLVHGFLAGFYNNHYIYSYSERALITGFKLAGLWAGLDGSLVFWTLVQAGMAAAVALQYRWSARNASGRRMEPYVYLVLCTVLGFFIALAIQQDAFSEMGIEQRLVASERSRIPMDSSGNLLDGHGLNPQLVNCWFVLHPPCLYIGLVAFSVPFTLALAALITGELGGYWLAVVRRWTMVAWIFLTSGIILGGLWAYRQLGWGGYWAWDPVENASFLPWCASTAFLHTSMVARRRGMLQAWSFFLILFSFFLTIEATYMTRSGEVASVHSFAGGSSIGTWFRLLKFGIAGAGFFALFLRLPRLRPAARLESLVSREAVLFLGSLVLVAICLAVWFLSWWPKISASYLGVKKAVGPPYYNLVMTPLFAILLLLTAVGPGLPWVRATWSAVRRHFARPLLFSAGVVLFVYLYLFLDGRIQSAADVLIPKPISDAWQRDTKELYHAVGLYPTGIFIFLGSLLISAAAAEVFRAVAARIRSRSEGEGLLASVLDTARRNQRRYAGHAIHAGMALLATGIVINSMFKVERQFHLGIGEAGRIGPYEITPEAANRSFWQLESSVADLRSGRRTMAELEPGLPYLRDEVLFRVTRAAASGSTLSAAHGEEEHPAGASPDAAAAAGARAAPEAAGAGPLVCELRPERRFYPKQDQWIREVAIHRMLMGDIYVYYDHRDEADRVYLTAYINPLMALIWTGWFVMIAGAFFALVPWPSRARPGRPPDAGPP